MEALKDKMALLVPEKLVPNMVAAKAALMA